MYERDCFIMKTINYPHSRGLNNLVRNKLPHKRHRTANIKVFPWHFVLNGSIHCQFFFVNLFVYVCVVIFFFLYFLREVETIVFINFTKQLNGGSIKTMPLYLKKHIVSTCGKIKVVQSFKSPRISVFCSSFRCFFLISVFCLVGNTNASSASCNQMQAWSGEVNLLKWALERGWKWIEVTLNCWFTGIFRFSEYSALTRVTIQWVTVAWRKVSHWCKRNAT